MHSNKQCKCLWTHARIQKILSEGAQLISDVFVGVVVLVNRGGGGGEDPINT